MRHAILALTMAASTAACGPTPLSATEAALVLEAYVAGAPDAVDVCAPGGRDHLRNAVRAYGAAMTENGAVWPNLAARDAPQEQLSALEISVVIAFAAGFIDDSDFPATARPRAQRMALANLPQMMQLRGVAAEACGEVVTMQRAAARYMLEMERYRHVIEGARSSGGEAAVGRILAQNAALKRAQEDMRHAAALIQARMNE